MPKKKKVENSPYLAKNLKSRRIDMGLKQEDVALALGLDRTSITYYEQGAHEPPIMVLIRLAKILQTSVQALISPPTEELVDRRYVTQTNADNLQTAALFSSPGSRYNPDGENDAELYEKQVPAPVPQNTLPKMTKDEVLMITLSRQLTDKQVAQILEQMKKLDDDNKNRSLD